MMPPRSFSVFAIVFAVVYSITYVIAVENNYALFTYHPVLVEFSAWTQPPKEGPAMYWYGWMATAGVVASVAGFIASHLRERLTKRLWSGWSWAVPLAVLVAFCYLLRGFFLR